MAAIGVQQVTAEQLLAQARDAKVDIVYRAQRKTRVADSDELETFKAERRSKYEVRIAGKNRQTINGYVAYATFEESVGEFDRVRSVWERAVAQMPEVEDVWLKYSNFELRHGNINRCRNVLDRATKTLPNRVKAWLRFVQVEETLGDVGRVREVFDAWLLANPTHVETWRAYADFECAGGGDNEYGRGVYERWCGLLPSVRAYVEYAQFEEGQDNIDEARKIFERACGLGVATPELPLEKLDEREDFWLAFTGFEERRNEDERARALYAYALDPSHDRNCFDSVQLRDAFVYMEETLGEAEDAEAMILESREAAYRKSIAENPHDVDSWLDLANMHHSLGNLIETRRVFEQAALMARPESDEHKDDWRRYIHVFVRHHLFEVLDCGDEEAGVRALDHALDVIPHAHFTFAKIWRLKAQSAIRQGSLSVARKTYSRGLKLRPTTRLFKDALHMETTLREIGRVRKLYVKWLKFDPSNEQIWLDFVELESTLHEDVRAKELMTISAQFCAKSHKLASRLVSVDPSHEAYERLCAIDAASFEEYARAFTYDAEVVKKGQSALGDVFVRECIEQCADEDTKDTLTALLEPKKRTASAAGLKLLRAAKKFAAIKKRRATGDVELDVSSSDEE